MNVETITLLGGTEVTINWKGKRSRCHYCSILIMFAITTKNNKYIPINQVLNIDKEEIWEAHFDSCPNSDVFKRKQKEQQEEQNQEALNNF